MISVGNYEIIMFQEKSYCLTLYTVSITVVLFLHFRTYGEHHGNCDTAYPQVETVFLSIFIGICLKEGFKLNFHLRKNRKN